MVFSVLSATAIILITSRVIEKNAIRVALFETKRNNDQKAVYYATTLERELNAQLFKLNNFAVIAAQSQGAQISTMRPLYDQLLTQIAATSPSALNVWDSWELSYTNPKWEFPYGRTLYFFEHSSYGVEASSRELDLGGDDESGYYYAAKTNPVETISSPEWFASNLGNIKRQYGVRLMVPHMANDQFVGLCGMDYSLSLYQTYIDSLNNSQPYNITVISNQGNIIAHANMKLIGRNITEIDTLLNRQFDILQALTLSEGSGYTLKNQNGADSVYYSLALVKIGQSDTHWGVMVAAPLEVIEQRVSVLFKFVYRVSLLGLLILTLVVVWFSLTIVRPLQRTKKILYNMSRGEVHGLDKLAITSDDELGEMADSVNKLVEGINKMTGFAENIGNGHFEQEIDHVANDDELGNAIIEMRNSLKQASIDEKNRLTDDANLNWASHGFNIFNRILRVDNQNLDNLTREIIETLTNYLGAHMGGVYLKKHSAETAYELVAHIGFSKDKYTQRFINPNQGTVGRCILEKETIFINEVPADYEKVGSGLGRSIPASILVVPLLTNNELIGIIELESLKQIEPYQVNFVEKLSETIAATINTVKINVRTAVLLEKSQKQAEELEQQEEEMRQNMEEMQATQEEAGKRESELSVMIDGFQELLLITEYDLKQRIVDVNDNYLNLLKLTKSQVIGKQHHADLFMDEVEQNRHKAFWDGLLSGHIQETTEYIRSGKEDFWLQEMFIPVKDQYGAIQKVLCVGVDITDEKKVENEIKMAQEGFYEKAVKKSRSKQNLHTIDLEAQLNKVDLTYLKMVYKKDAAKIYNIVKLYYDTLPQQVYELDEIHKQRDFAKLKAKINGLKTKMSYLGLKHLYEQLRNVEKLLAENKNLVELPKILGNVIKEWELAQAEIKQLLQIP